jgi:protein-disulfide isomerase
MKAYPGKVRVVYRDFPLNFHPNAKPAAIAARCAGNQGKYWEMHDVLFENQ